MNKMNASSEKDMEKLIAKYNQDLMRYYQKNKSRIIPASQETAAATENVSAVPAAEAVSPVTETIDIVKKADAIPEKTVMAETTVTASAADSSSKTTPEVSFSEPNPSAQDEDELDMPSGMRTAPEVLEEEITPEPEQTEPDQLLGENEPEHLEGNDNGTGAPATETGREPDNDEEEDDSDTGYLQIRAFTARSALPIQNAFVTISKKKKTGEDLTWLALTDSDGVTEVLSLPTVSRNASLEPGGPVAFSVYNIQIDAAGYYSVRNIGVPIYGGITAVQPVELIPLPEQTGSGNLVFPEAGPEELE